MQPIHAERRNNMFGITSSGCFVMGIIIGFILALIIGAACIFHFNPNIKKTALTKVESVWGEVKSNVDSSIDAAKKAPTAEPHIPRQKTVAAPPERKTRNKLQIPGTPAQTSIPRIEVKIGI